ncbi:HofO [Enterobacter cloacae complex sp. P31C]|uniref:HofO family protein n=1 Tax=Enterobacter TaxID=547 RepID=UPI00186710F1|nr:HofO [Enterobacter cloacae complex sp. P31C]
MDTLLERWCESRPWCRLVCGGLAILLMGLAAWGVLLRPVEQQCAERQQQLIQAARTNASLWPTASQAPFSPQTRTALELKPFSPLDFQGEGTRLLYWKPLQNGGELALEAEWQAIPPLFSRLAQRDVWVAAFTLSPQNTALRLRLELEHAK